jgi:predicted Zn finger-like uncharacterized protein
MAVAQWGSGSNLKDCMEAHFRPVITQLTRERNPKQQQGMILTCPQCSTRYHVDATALGATGRTVRCASCGQRWSVKPPADAPQTVEFAPAQAAPARVRPVAAAEHDQNRRSVSLIGWLVAVLVVLIAASAVIGRNEIVAGFPASALIYHKLNLPITVEHGLQFAEITSTRLEEGGIAVLVVEGAVINVTSHDRAVPPIRITLLDSGGRELQEELFRAKEEHLEPGAKTSFSGRVVNPADQARNFSVTFEVAS